MTDARREDRYLVAAAMKNEGAFLVEWVSWYRMLGFEILVVVNDCTDASPEMLDIFARAGWLQWQGHFPKPGTQPKGSGHRAIRNHPATAATDWLLICDVDEFLVLHEGDGTIADYMTRRRPRMRGIAFHWKSFGTGGQETWSDSLVHRTFTLAAPEKEPANTPFKSMFRGPIDFKGFGAHSPRRFVGEWGRRGNVLIDSGDRVMRRFDPHDRPKMATSTKFVTHRTAQMNHYIIRWEEAFALKRGMPSPSAGVDRYNDEFYAKYNRNDETDETALRYADRFDRIHAEAMALPGMARLHHLSCAHFVGRLAEKQGKAAEDDPRHAFHLAEAARLGSD